MAGETVFLLHSSGSSPRQWSALAERIPRHFRMRVAAPALIGHEGEDPWAAGVSPSLDGEVDRLAARLGSPAGGIHLVGHSYGGAVALKAALSGRFDVRSLTMYEPPLVGFLGAHTPRYDPRESPVTIGWRVTELFLAGAIEDAARTYVDYWSVPGFFDRMPADKRLRMVERMPVVVDCFSALFGDGARPADLARLDMPVLALTGNRSPRPSQDIAELVAGSAPIARLHRFSELDHMGPVTNPAAVNAVIEEFLWDAAAALPFRAFRSSRRAA